MLQLNEVILGPTFNTTTQAALALDIKGAFDNVDHQLILRNLTATSCGVKMYNDLRNFLRNRAATIGAGDLCKDPVNTPNKGTPHGAVISPTLLNLAVSELPPILERIPHMKCTPYADDLTIWTVSGSDREKQDALQAAVDEVQRYLRQAHLQILAARSVFILVCETRRSRRKPEPRDVIQVFLDDGSQILLEPRTRILGLHLQEVGKATHTLTLLQNQVTQILRIMHRVASRQHGLKEVDAIELVNALVVSHITHATPYMNLTKRNEEKLDVLIRKAYETNLWIHQTPPLRSYSSKHFYNGRPPRHSTRQTRPCPFR
ncbi:hypothetical protein HPB47_003094 [Ixodes persulcatus]|uniref:Uncharacterized protein n=1 Tax=Ixodes persulcatus TaxID=34615 RepID=A0AC60PJG1_IXOPE|nr:hypothetical protein HPB47_003094 [Ixodes persulcatus]